MDTVKVAIARRRSTKLTDRTAVGGERKRAPLAPAPPRQEPYRAIYDNPRVAAILRRAFPRRR